MREYDSSSNFFDPDSFFTTGALLSSGDAFLQEEVKRVLMRTGRSMNSVGQVPHHFTGGGGEQRPVFTAISQATQPGPNVFWASACLNYAKTTGDMKWLKEYMPKLREGLSYLMTQEVHKESKLFAATGALMIDIFKRNGVTSDTNAMLVGFFENFASAEDAVGDKQRATELRERASKISGAMNQHMWSKDHYKTSLNGHDLVDYDSNFVALAHGIPSQEAAEKLFARVDDGPCRAAPGWVSEKYYGEADTMPMSRREWQLGDSWVAMGRIAYFDGLARKRYKKGRDFSTRLMEPLKKQVLDTTWMHERLSCDGSQQRNRTGYFFEYPSVTAMMLHDIRYGIKFGMNSVEIDPLDVSSFSFRTGNIDVAYSPSEVRVTPLATGRRYFTIGGRVPKATYHVSILPAGPEIGTITADASGSLHFEEEVAPGSSVLVRARADNESCV
eukprot:gnl/TRDRNA2_/TRDRNA2_73562_c1_seq1.p1 gnl/TRDRNA2_/TRDRNA2_73562_c1~~gnl/TRDRNA2_/TRDRNA2_73562_c1_seq1.p1  ORF type:complete len:444 (-),score=68.00 gnl/TRDRNA2_/TRDRNA2_73562_c1_seq1:39-1370(-)